jgi:hypothetical protein
MVPVTFDEHPPFSTEDTHLPCSQTTDDKGGRRHTAGEQSELVADDGELHGRDAEEDLEDEGNVAVMDEGRVHERTRDV